MCSGLIPIRRRTARALAIITVLAVAAGCSSGESIAPDTASVAPAASSAASQPASASASPSEAASLEADHIFGATVPGYEFVELPRAVARQARRQFAASAGLDRDEAEFDLRSLTKGGTPDSLVLVVALSPEYAALPGTDEGFAGGIAESAGTEPDDVELGGTDGYLIDTGAQQIVAWQDHNLLVAVFAENRRGALAAARAIVEATG